MKNCEVAEPSVIIAKMLKASSDTGVWLVAELANDKRWYHTIWLEK